jgi:hypothetical protein
MTVCT